MTLADILVVYMVSVEGLCVLKSPKYEFESLILGQFGGHFSKWLLTLLASAQQPGSIHKMFERNYMGKTMGDI